MKETLYRTVAKERRVRIMALAGASLWVGLFAVLFRPAPPNVPASVPLPPKLQYAFMRPEGLWSPQLFSLPSVSGFSGLLVVPENGLRPRLDLPAPESAFLDHEPPAPATGPDDLAFQVRSLFASQRPRRRSFSTAHIPPPFEVRVLEGFDPSDLIRRDIPPDLIRAKSGWRALLEVEAGPAGDISHVFVLNEDQMGRNRAPLLRAVRQWRLKSALSERRGILLVSGAGTEGEARYD